MPTCSSRFSWIVFFGGMLLCQPLSGFGVAHVAEGFPSPEIEGHTGNDAQTGIADLTTGRFENQWVSFTGTIRHCVAQDARTSSQYNTGFRLSIASVGKSIDVIVKRLPPADLNQIIDSTVRVHGQVRSYRNRKGQFLAPFVLASEAEDVHILSLGPNNPFNEVLQPIGQLLTSVDRKRGDHRVRTRGVVTNLLPPHEVYIQDGTDAILVQTPTAAPVHLGDFVDVVGFEATGDSSPHLEDGIVRKASESVPPPQALRTTLAAVVDGELDARLVQVSGTIFDVVQRPNELLIVLQSGKNMIGSYLHGPADLRPPGIQAGAKVELTGVASLILDENHKPKSFSLQLRGPRDVHVLQKAPWWTAQKAILLLAGALSLVLLIAIWVMLLRKRVSAQTRLIRATLDGTADAILVLDAKHFYVDANEKFKTLWSLDSGCCQSNQAVLKKLTPRLTDPSAFTRLLKRHTSVGQASTVLTLVSGEVFECDYERIQGSSTNGVVLSFRDITSRQKAERLERDRNQILEAISREDRLDLILSKVCCLAEHQDHSIRCRIRLMDSKKRFVICDRGGSQFELESNELEALGTGFTTSYPVNSPEDAELGQLLLTSPFNVPATNALREVIGITTQLASIAIEHRQLFDRLDHLAYHDSLTGLLNRVALDEELQRAVDTAHKTDITFALLCIDLDRFKQINDTLSHRTGDLFICAVAERLDEAVVPHGAKVFRVGGDEFIILLPLGSAIEAADQVAEAILTALRRPFPIGDRFLHTTASIGVSLFPKHGATPAALQQAADSAMYKAKHAGRDQHKVFLAEWRVQEDGSFEMEALLRQAIESSWFEMHYQPKVTKGRRICGLEALIRLRHPQIGLIPPDRFITIAEDSGLIPQIGAWALNEVCGQIRTWRDNGISTGRVAVNVSAAQFSRGDFLKTVQRILAHWNLSGEVLELELTESLLMTNVAEATELMKQLRSIGVDFSIDDFGTGYSSLGYLHALPVRNLKIDRSFVATLTSSNGSEPLIRTIIQLAKSLGLGVVAEGVETEEQFNLLHKLECDQFQGFLFSRPQRADKIEPMLIENSSNRREYLFRPVNKGSSPATEINLAEVPTSLVH